MSGGGVDAIIRAMDGGLDTSVSPADTNRGPVVAIDGPVASGKTSVGRVAATRLGLRFLDTGIMYRALTWLALHCGQRVDDDEVMGRLAESCSMSVAGYKRPAIIIVDGHPLSADDLTSEEIDRNVSAVAAGSATRRALVMQQRAIAADGGIVMVGRDIGSVVLPDADVKLYFEASPEERARRRLQQQKEAGSVLDYQQALADTNRRDRLDSQRADSPLTVPNGAIVIDTERLDFAQCVAAVISRIDAGSNTHS